MTNYDCRKCGACCVGQLVVLVKGDERVPIPVRSRDGMRLGEAADGRCIALTGRIGIDVSCSVYDQRPKMCRAFAPESEHCKRLRRHMGLE